MILSLGWPSRVGTVRCPPRVGATPARSIRGSTLAEDRRWLPDPVLLATIEDRVLLGFLSARRSHNPDTCIQRQSSKITYGSNILT